MHKVTLIPGDGIGPEVVFATKSIIESTGIKIDWDIQNARATVIEDFGSPIPR